MSEKFNEEIVEEFDSILAEELSIAVHTLCCDCCPHNIGIPLAQIAHKHYANDDLEPEEDVGEEEGDIDG